MNGNSKPDTNSYSDPSIIQDQICLFLKMAINKNLPYKDIIVYLFEKQFLLSDIKLASEQTVQIWEQEKHETSSIRSMGFAWLVTGFAILMLPMNHNQHQPAYIIAYAVLFWGAIKWTHGWIRNNQLKNRLSSMGKWKDYLKIHEQEYFQNPSYSETFPFTFSFIEGSSSAIQDKGQSLE